MEKKIYTLKLDAAWQPIEVIEGLRAFSMVYSGRAQVVENHSYRLNALFYFPSVIVLNSYVRKKQINLSPTRLNVYWRDKYTCQYCNKRFVYSQLTLDHVIPKSRGGQKNWNNIVTSCQNCNQIKADRTPQEASMLLVKEPKRPIYSVLASKPEFDIPEEWKRFIKEN